MKLSAYWPILRIFWGSSLAAELEYRVNFLVAALTSLANFSGSLFSLFLFYRTGYTFAGWSWPEALMVLGVFTWLEGFASTLLTPNLSKIVQYVQLGTLDFVLLKPISSQFWLSLRTISPWGIPDLILGLAIIVYSGSQLGLAWTAYAQGSIPLISGMVILYSLWFILGATSIWFVKIYNATEVLRGLVQAGRFPMVAYPVAYRFFFTFVIPVAFLTTIPSEAMLGRVEWPWLVGSVVLALGLLLAAQGFWRFALRFYTSASS